LSPAHAHRDRKLYLKRALIVDDSRLARAVLSRLLTEHGVATDTAETAEIALDYLKHSRPDVVFLDHNMPGIDGFEALEAIKTNPATATIPVMMYTSQEGELYVGQARALGALGVLPKTVQPVEVAQVLRTLHLIPTEGSPTAPTPPEPAVADAAPPETPPAAAPPSETTAEPVPATFPPPSELLDSAKLRALLEELLSEHVSALREEMRGELAHFSALSTMSLLPPTAPRAGNERYLKIASVLLAAFCALLAYLYFATSSSLDEANSRTRQLAADTAALSDARTSTLAAAGASREPDAAVLDVLEWGVNQGGRYSFGSVPLDDERAAVVSALFEQLERLGFAGTVAIDVHVGRFCMNYEFDGMLELAPPDQPAATCEQVGWPESEAVAMGQRQSLAFANAVAAASAKNPRLQVEHLSHGSAEPAIDYPTADYELTAGAWNAIAAANQRVAVRLVADAPGGPRR
jgi:CheY-like chemotaxis protein